MPHRLGCLLICLLLTAEALAGPRSPLLAEPLSCPAVPYLVICPEKAVGVVEPLVRLHQQSALPGRIVSAEAIYKWAGQASPSAIASFLRHLPRSQMKFVLLVGCADAKAELFLPATMTPARYVHPTLACDEYFYSDLPYAQPAEGAAPDLAVGRLPARSVGELRGMVALAAAAMKAEPGPWQRKVELVAGRAEVNPALDALLDVSLQRLIDRRSSEKLELHLLSGRQTDQVQSADPRPLFLQRLNAAPAMLIYVGHGRPDALGRLSNQSGQTPILTSADCVQLALPCPRTLVLAIACQTGDFVRAGSLCEAMLACKAGPGAFIGASGISQPYGNAVLANVLSDVLADAPATAGELLLELRSRLWTCTDSGLTLLDLPASALLGGQPALQAQIRDTAVMYNLLGDPAMPLGCKREAASPADRPARSTADSVAPRAGAPSKPRALGGFD